ncbi:MAG: hypothetical protein CMB77_04535 [Euryarchaeota archaeon]|nr:hypothetical protein [Euryarchaeota archaeon]|tara:strand:+ start:5630 stop:5815 length:186 start_codon:yes stop_codon:yes gene_type:complete
MSDITNKWQEIKTLIESLEVDIVKNANGNASAGVRARRGLRALKGEAASLVKLSLERDKSK